MMHQIILNSVCQQFKNQQETICLFENLSISLRDSQSISITGASGTGKSSLLLLLAGLESPKQGTVDYLIDQNNQSLATLRQNSGFIFQQFHLLPELDAVSNLALPLKLKGDKDATEKAHHWLDKVGLSNRAKHKPNQLSGGEQQRVAIARAFITHPKFVFADEPTGNLDEKTAGGIVQLMFECSHQNNTGLVVVTHSTSLAKQTQLCYRLSQGKLALSHH